MEKRTATDVSYVHGYSPREWQRLNDQAETLERLLHHDTVFPPGSLVLEAGCGVGAQTRFVAAANPGARFVSIDLSLQSASRARSTAIDIGIRNAAFSVANLFQLPFNDGAFDAVFVCFVLEHLSKPALALLELRRVLAAGGTLMVIEGDHGSTFFHPDSAHARSAIDALVALQASNGGDANIGRRLHPLLSEAGFGDVAVSPRMVYVDASKPRLVEGFTRNTFTAMIEGVRDEAVGKGFIDTIEFELGVRDLYRTAQTDGVFCYTFFKAFGKKRG